MLNYLVAGIVILLLAILALLVDIARKLGQILHTLAHGAKIAFMKKTPGHCGGEVWHVEVFSVWIYQGGTWTCLETCGRPHCHCSAPPLPGSYEGQVVRKECDAG